MDWTFWVGGIAIVVLVIVTQVFLHESRWSQRPRPAEPDEPETTERPTERDEPDDRR
ncbi:hypothetical protein [Agromyces sp. ZXT2-6]|uniref:hypothetical protein n=1 Tax=Agromyces sp. ZXT2-6 TaxID=3461153 RepID=UPI00405511FA